MTGKAETLGQLDAPYISSSGVRSILDAIVRAEPSKAHNSMLALHIVDLYLLDHQLPNSDRTRFFALADLMVDAITTAYIHLREALTGTEEQLPSTREQLISILQEDIMMSTTTLQDWGVLLVDYVFVEYDISSDDLAELLNTTPRNLRRYRDRAVSRLTERMIALEQKAIEKVRQIRLLAALPLFHSNLIGRDHELATLMRSYRMQPGCFMAVVGPPGIGKSHLITTFLRTLIEQSPPRHIFRLDHAESIEAIARYISDRTLYHLPGVTLQEYSTAHNIVLVLERPLLESDALIALNERLPQICIVLLLRETPEGHLRSKLNCYIVLEPLRNKNAQELIEQTAEHDGIFDATAGRKTLSIVSGVPGHLKAQVRQLHAVSTAGISFLAAGCALHPQRRLPLTEPCVIGIIGNGNSPAQDSLSGIVGDHVQISERTAAAIRERWTNGLDIDALQEQVITLTTNTNSRYSARTRLDLAETLLSVFAWQVSSTFRQQIVFSCWRDAALYRRNLLWIHIIDHEISRETEGETANEESRKVRLLIAKAHLLERTEQRTEVNQMLQEAIQLAGMRGDFEAQQLALATMATHLRRQGDYSGSLKIVENVLRQPLTDHIEDLCKVEQLKIFVETKQWQAFDAIMNSGSFQPGRTILALQCHRVYAEEDFDAGIAIVQQMEQKAPHETEQEVPLAYTTAMIARGHMGAGRLDEAADAFARATHLLDETDDPVLFHRIFALYGTLLMNTGETQEAKRVLKRTRQYQEVINDRVGLAATHHNLRGITMLENDVDSP
ncbi:MAG: hypothetical protein AAFU54_22040 [Chloroflexota bacterium]